jgi:hypothetical protein
MHVLSPRSSTRTGRFAASGSAARLIAGKNNARTPQANFKRLINSSLPI